MWWVFCYCEVPHWTAIINMADDGDEWAQEMVKDIEMNGKQANRPQGGMHHKRAGQYAGYVKAFLEFPK